MTPVLGSCVARQRSNNNRGKWAVGGGAGQKEPRAPDHRGPPPTAVLMLPDRQGLPRYPMCVTDTHGVCGIGSWCVCVCV
ncbi:hypothetical protein EYF80_059526 [Liparis tanakae]|uniref:Uncharacterized protein n=1 Tax=Liparis tanakae TaxID=230148 RepID=A0A4Z2EPT4_9TELE|nr:hypothetical protein EYF80_059526 [Liparis tanakae]